MSTKRRKQSPLERVAAELRNGHREPPDREPTPEELPLAQPEDRWPRPLGDDGFYGLAGEIVRAIEPHTEADPAAILLQLLTGFGSIIGRTAHFQVENTQHYLNLFVVLMGETARGRKGTSWDRCRELFSQTDPDWADRRIVSGLSSGEGLIWGVRDPIEKQEAVKERGRIVGYQAVMVDPGIEDKRLLVIEPEFASVLRVIERQSNILSSTIRQAWDSGNLRTLTKNAPAVATGAHVSIVGHVTLQELRRYLTNTEAANGFANRFLWVCVRRSQLLPEGSDYRLHPGYGDRLRDAVGFARNAGRLTRSESARQQWREAYEQLSADRPGMAGAMLARAEAQVTRLSCLYCLLDCERVIQPEHQSAAMAIWKYCEESVLTAFGDCLGDPLADEILDALRRSPDGLTRAEIRQVVGKHANQQAIRRALGLLNRFRLARVEAEETGGRPAERWQAGAGI